MPTFDIDFRRNGEHAEVDEDDDEEGDEVGLAAFVWVAEFDKRRVISDGERSAGDFMLGEGVSGGKRPFGGVFSSLMGAVDGGGWKTKMSSSKDIGGRVSGQEGVVDREDMDAECESCTLHDIDALDIASTAEDDAAPAEAAKSVANDAEGSASAELATGVVGAAHDGGEHEREFRRAKGVLGTEVESNGRECEWCSSVSVGCKWRCSGGSKSSALPSSSSIDGGHMTFGSGD